MILAAAAGSFCYYQLPDAGGRKIAEGTVAIETECAVAAAGASGEPRVREVPRASARSIDVSDSRGEPASAPTRIVGRVVDAAGCGIAGVRVHFWYIDWSTCTPHAVEHAHAGEIVITGGGCRSLGLTPDWIFEDSTPPCEFQVDTNARGDFDWNSTRARRLAACVVHARGYYTELRTIGIEQRAAGLVPGETYTIPDIRLERGARFEGRLYGSDGGVFSIKCNIKLLGIAAPELYNESARLAVGGARCDPARGEFAFEGVAPGWYRIYVDAPSDDWISPPFCIKMGESGPREFILPFPARESCITVRVEPPHYAPMPDQDNVTIVPAGGGMARTAERTYGGFIFRDVPSGKYNLKIDDGRFLPFVMNDIEPDIKSFDAHLEGGGELEIVAIDRATGEGLTSPKAAFGFDGAGPRWEDAEEAGSTILDFPTCACQLMIYDPEHSEQTITIPAVARGEKRVVNVALDRCPPNCNAPARVSGRVEIRGRAQEPEDPSVSVYLMKCGPIKDGGDSEADSALLSVASNFEFKVTAAGRYFLRAALDGRIAESSPFNLESGGALDDILLTIPPESTLKGKFTNMGALANHKLAICLHGRASTFTQPAFPDGSYNFKNLGAGEYTVILSGDGEIGPLQIGAFEIGVGEEKSLDFDLGSHAPCVVTVAATIHGLPAAAARITARYVGSEDIVADGRTDDSGMIQFNDILAGDLVLGIVPAGFDFESRAPRTFGARANDTNFLRMDFLYFDGTIQIFDAKKRPVVASYVDVERVDVAGGPCGEFHQAKRTSKYNISLPPGRYRFQAGPFGYSEVVEWTAAGPSASSVTVPEPVR